MIRAEGNCSCKKKLIIPFPKTNRSASSNFEKKIVCVNDGAWHFPGFIREAPFYVLRRSFNRNYVYLLNATKHEKNAYEVQWTSLLHVPVLGYNNPTRKVLTMYN